MLDPEITLTLNLARVEFSRTGDGGYGFAIALRADNGAWRSITAQNNPFIRGSTFDLRPTEALRIKDSEVRFSGTQGFPFTAKVVADAKRGWFCFDIEIELAEPLELSVIEGFAPEIMLDLGQLPPYERGDHVWFMTNVANPTKWNDDAYGNDMPATYLFDAYLRAEFFMFFDMTAMDWMSKENTGRFLNYRCGYRRRYANGVPAASLGLYLDGMCGRTLPAGKHRFVYYVAVAARAETPTDQEAVQWLVERCLPLLPPHCDWPARATSWRDAARACARDLMTAHAWHKSADGEYILNYVDAHSPAWKEAIDARGREFKMDQPCLESGVWGAHPLEALSRIDSEPLFDTLRRRMLDFVHRMVVADRTPLTAAVDDEPRGTWQHVYIVEQMLQLARFERNEPLLQRIRSEVDSVIVPLAQKMQYMFPLSFGKKSLAKRGSGDAHSLLGTYASLMLDMHEWTSDTSYLDEAKRALRVNHALPINTVHQEIFMLAMGVHAAARLETIARDGEFAQIAQYLLAQTLRMMYWFDDRTTADARKLHTLGMFQACATISYPAIFENIETVARIAAAMKVLPVTEPLLRVFDHARKNNLYFLPAYLHGHDDLPLKFVPLENIGILEGPTASSVGAEIYGAGWVFRAYLLWEAFGRCSDREIMVLNCDAFDERRQLESGTWNLTFLAFNPTTDAREAEIIFPLAIERAATLTDDGEPRAIAGGKWTTRLLPGEARKLKLCVDVKA